ncbi:uncharacterized protein L203_103346 [Cryptococcus depauperatus CBS 7841]|uniref:Uncharacterized protein n=1 Tax=Cryptococcus depauperatus CBS 7841 TaxID=1295531 RepID=A0AAJ8JTF5_9TREE
MSFILTLTVIAPIVSSSAFGQNSTSLADTTKWTANSSLELARLYVGFDFPDKFDFFTDNDPTGGTVHYVSKKEGPSEGMVDVQAGDVFMSRVGSDYIAIGRSKDSIGSSSKDYFEDGVYILDLNYLSISCDEINILEGANGLPSKRWLVNTHCGEISKILEAFMSIIDLEVLKLFPLCEGSAVINSTGTTYTAAGCPEGCQAFVKANPSAFIKLTDPSILFESTLLLKWKIWRRKLNVEGNGGGKVSKNIMLPGVPKELYTKLASHKSRLGPTKLALDRGAHDYLEGEIPTAGFSRFYQRPINSSSPTSSDVMLNDTGSFGGPNPLEIRQGSAWIE